MSPERILMALALLNLAILLFEIAFNALSGLLSFF